MSDKMNSPFPTSSWVGGGSDPCQTKIFKMLTMKKMYQKQKLTCVEGTKCSAFDVFSVAMVTVNFLGMASYSLFIKSIQVYNQFFVNTTVVPCMRRTLY